MLKKIKDLPNGVIGVRGYPHLEPGLMACPARDSDDVSNVRMLLERHFVATKSSLALDVLTNFEDYQERFWVIIPRGTGAKLELAVSAKEG